jgi:hypothetical protein
MKEKLNRRELVQAGLLTGAALALAACPAAPTDAAEGSATAATEGLTDPTYYHVRACCTPTWHNPACPGDPSCYSDKGGNPCQCVHNC